MIFSRLTLLVVSAVLSGTTNAHYHHNWGAGEGEGWHHPHGEWKGEWKGGLRGDKGHSHGDGGHGGRGGHGGHGGRGGRGSAAITVEKGFKCTAGGFTEGDDESSPKEESGALKSFNGCEGGTKKTFPERSHPHAIAADTARTLQEHMQENLIPDVSDLMPPSDTMVELLELAPENLLGLEEGESRSVKFGGKSEMFFECSISVTMKGGKPVKTSACGFKSHGQMGKKDAEDEMLEALVIPIVEEDKEEEEEMKVAQFVVTEEVEEVMEKLENGEDSSEEVDAEIKD